MKDIIIFPIKSNSERVPGKNFLKVDGVPMYQIVPSRALDVGFGKVIIDTDSPEITEWAESVGIEVIPRLPELALNTANGNSLLRHHVKVFPEYDIYWQGFVTCPFISTYTLKRVRNILTNSPVPSDFDSIMTVKEHKGFFWDRHGHPITFRPEVLPRGQELEPIYEECSGVFGIAREAFNKTMCRVGVNPRFFVLPEEETLDIDWKEDADKIKAR